MLFKVMHHLKVMVSKIFNNSKKMSQIVILIMIMNLDLHNNGEDDEPLVRETRKVEEIMKVSYKTWLILGHIFH